MMLARSCLLVAACVMLSAAACPGAGRSTEAGRTGADDYLLRLIDGKAQLFKKFQTPGEEPMWVQAGEVSEPAAVPYCIVHRAAPAVVTTCGADLIPVTYVIGAQILRFESMLPQLVEPPVIALASLAGAEDAPGTRSLLLDADGTVLWEHPNAQLLTPACGPAGDAPVLAVPTSGDFMAPYGPVPELLAIDPRTGEQRWQTGAGEPLGQLCPDYIELMCVADDYGLLSLWYGYDMFRFLAVRFSDGEITELHTLYGQPSILLVQPGAMPAYRHCDTAGSTVELEAVDLQRGGGLLKFDLAAGTAEFAQQPIEGPRMVEENLRPVGGALADPADPPYPQALLPTAFEPPWTIPALTDGQRFLVITAAGAAWRDY